MKKMMCEYGPRRAGSQHFFFFITNKWAQKVRVLQYIRLERLVREKRYILLGPFVSCGENEVLWIRLLLSSFIYVCAWAKLQIIEWNRSKVFNSRSGCVYSMRLYCYEAKLPNLKLKMWPLQLLCYIPLNIIISSLGLKHWTPKILILQFKFNIIDN